MTTLEANNAHYQWNTEIVVHDFCPACGGGTSSDSRAVLLDCTQDGTTRRIGFNAPIFDIFDAAAAPVSVIDGKILWQQDSSLLV